MNITPTAVTNATNVSLFMVNLTERLLRDYHQHGARSVLDLKAHYRGSRLGMCMRDLALSRIALMRR